MELSAGDGRPSGLAPKHRGPLEFGIAGLGGYASYVTDRVLDEMKSEHPAARLRAVCDPELGRYPERVADLRQQGVVVTTDFHDLLNSPVQAVWLPLPIDLHGPYTEQALGAGKAVLCEKPAAGCVEDVDAMIAARDRTKLPVAIGFQDLYQPAVAALKGRILRGDFGAPLSATVIGCWPRGEAYFTRNNWAGRFRRAGRWVMDSPAANAMAHFLHLPLFLLGPSLGEAVSPIGVSAELYRANPIENFDTCSLRFTLPGDVPLYAAFTHACETNVEPVVEIEFETARIRYIAGENLEIIQDGQVQRLALSSNPHHHMLAMFQKWVHDGPSSAFGATLETARVHVVAVNAASELSPVTEVPHHFISAVSAPEHVVLRVIRDIVPMLMQCIQRKLLLHETQLSSWSYRSAAATINGYRRFTGPCAHNHARKHRTVEVSIPGRAAGRPAVEA